jgi:hypothetical protein
MILGIYRSLHARDSGVASVFYYEWELRVKQGWRETKSPERDNVWAKNEESFRRGREAFFRFPRPLYGWSRGRGEKGFGCTCSPRAVFFRSHAPAQRQQCAYRFFVVFFLFDDRFAAFFFFAMALSPPFSSPNVCCAELQSMLF